MSSSPEPETVRGRRPTADRLLGTVLDGQYTLEAAIATGGFGAVYRARMPDGTAVAVKLLHPQLARDPSLVTRFRREGATMLQLHDPHTVTTFAVGEARGPEGNDTLYIAMELLVGDSLHDRLHRVRALPWREAVAIARQVCSSLAEAHAIGVVHRDLKPANIHLEPGVRGEHVKVIDFGIAKVARGSAVDDGQELTVAGHMIGTCDYMSPEQVQGNECGPASDIYAFGTVLYEMMTGARPFADAVGPGPLITAMLTQTPAPPSLHAVIPLELDRIVMRCLAREPEDRFASIGALVAALDLLEVVDEPRDDTMIEPPLEPPLASDGDTIRDDGVFGVRNRWLDPRTVVDPRGIESPAPRPAPDIAPTYATLPGVAVASLTPSRTVAPPTFDWQTPAVQTIWIPPTPQAPMARGSAPALPSRASHVMWYALVVLCTAAAVLAAATC